MKIRYWEICQLPPLFILANVKRFLKAISSQTRFSQRVLVFCLWEVLISQIITRSGQIRQRKRGFVVKPCSRLKFLLSSGRNNKNRTRPHRMDAKPSGQNDQPRPAGSRRCNKQVYRNCKQYTIYFGVPPQKLKKKKQKNGLFSNI